MIPASQITDFIYVGSIGNVRELETNNPLGIEWILNCTEEFYRPAKGIKKCWMLSMPDESQCHYSIVLFGVLQIHRAEREQKKILVHCKGGVSRSRCIVAAYLALCKNQSWDEALAFVLAKRALSRKPNPVTVATVKNAVEKAKQLKTT